jgi:hypothetical protein
MAKETSEDVILGLWTAVAKREMTMHEAEKRLHEHVNGLPEAKQKELREKAVLWGRWLSSVTDGFAQQMAVIGAGQ